MTKIRSDNLIHVTLIRFIIFFLCMLQVVHFNFGGLALVLPNIIVMSIFYWGIYSEENVLDMKLLLLLSISLEIIKGVPIGLHTLIYAASFYFISNQKRFFIQKPFITIWVGFVIYFISVFFATMFLTGIVYKKAIFHDFFFMEIFLTITVYSLIHWFYSYLRLSR